MFTIGLCSQFILLLNYIQGDGIIQIGLETSTRFVLKFFHHFFVFIHRWDIFSSSTDRLDLVTSRPLTFALLHAAPVFHCESEGASLDQPGQAGQGRREGREEGGGMREGVRKNNPWEV